MQKHIDAVQLIEAAREASTLLAKAELSADDVLRAKTLLYAALRKSDGTPLRFLADAVRDAIDFAEHLARALPGAKLEDGKLVAVAADGSRWVKGAPATRGTYWFLVPYVEKFGCAGIYKGFYKQFDFEVSVTLETYGSVRFNELEHLWHLPLQMPEIPDAVALTAASRGTLERGLTGGDVSAFEAGEPDDDTAS